MRKKWRRLGALLVAATMALSLLPTAAVAATVAEPGDVVPKSEYTLSASNTLTSGTTAEEGPLTYATDGESGTHWHTDWTGNQTWTNANDRWIQISLTEAKRLSAFAYYPRSYVGVNGSVTQYRVVVCTDATVTSDSTWTEVATGTWTTTEEWKMANFNEPTLAKHVRLYGMQTAAGTGTANTHMTAGEVRLIAAVDRELTGTVSAGGSGLAEAKVTLVQGAAPYSMIANSPEATTGSNGSYTMNLTGLATGSYKIRVSKAGYGAVLGDAFTVASGTTAYTANATLTAIDTAEAKYSYTFEDMTTAGLTGKIEHVEMSNLKETVQNKFPTIAVENNALKINFTGDSRFENLISVKGTAVKNGTIEFDATRTSRERRFGLAFRLKDGGNWIYIGQFDGKVNGATAWGYNHWNGAQEIWGPNIGGPSFGPGETRHFKATIADGEEDGNVVTRVSFWVDGIEVINNADISSITYNGSSGASNSLTSLTPVREAADVGFIFGYHDNSGNAGGAETVVIDNIYVFREDPPVVVNLKSAADGSITAEIENTGGDNESLADGGNAQEGDRIRITGVPNTGKALAGLTVKKTGDATADAVAAEDNGDGTFTFVMPGYAVDVTPSFKNAVTGVTLSGTAEVGQTLTANLTPGNATVSYQWIRVTAEGTETVISNATAGTYTLADADKGNTVKVKVTGTGDYAGVQTSDATDTVVKKVTGVTLNKTTLDVAMPVTSNPTLTATFAPTNPSNRGIIWTSSDESIATVAGETNDDAIQVDENGRNIATITAKAPGTVTITAKSAEDENLKAECTVTIYRSIQNVSLGANEQSVQLWLNDPAATTKILTATTTPANVTGATWEWTSSDPTVASVTKDGSNPNKATVTGLATGTATITVTVSTGDGKSSASTTSTVRVGRKASGLTLSAANNVTTIYVNGNTELPLTVQLTPVFTPEGTSETVDWATSNSAVATVSSTGLVTARGNGTATITGTTDSGLTANLSITVKTRVLGSPEIAGTVRFGTETMATVAELTPAAARNTLTYQWYTAKGETAGDSDDPIASANEQHYTPVAEDVGTKIYAKVTAVDPYVGEWTTNLVTVGRAAGPNLVWEAPTYEDCTAAGANDGKIVGLYKGVAYEYKLTSATAWTPFIDESESETPEAGNPGTAEITGLAPGSYHIRRAATTTHEAGAPSRTFTIAVTGAELLNVNVADFANGAVRVSNHRPTAGETITLTVLPDEGFGLVKDSLVVTPTAGGTALELTAGEEGVYTFVMPETDVTVTAEFEGKTYTISHELANLSCSLEATEDGHAVPHGAEPEIIIEPATGFSLPDTVVVRTENGELFKGYTYEIQGDGTAKITFTLGITENLSIKAVAMPTVYQVDYRLNDLSADDQPQEVAYHTALNALLTADEGYDLPETITVTMGGGSVAYDYDNVAGTVRIATNVIEGDVVITAAGAKHYITIDKVSINGAAKVDQILEAVVTPEGAEVGYQWYHVTLNANGTIATETPISDATDARHALTEDDLGKNLAVKVTAVPGSDYTGNATSTPTGTVLAADAPTTPVDSVELRRTTLTLDPGESETLIATVRPSTATDKTLSWTSSAPEVVSVENGVVTAVASGTATITVTAEDGGQTAECEVTVRQVVEVTAEDMTVIYDGEYHEINVVVLNPAEGATITYASTAHGTFRPQCPRNREVGEYFIYYKVEAPDMVPATGSVVLSITKTPAEVGISANRTSLSGAGTVTLTVTVSENAEDGIVVVTCDDSSVEILRNEDGTYSAQLPAAAKEYTFTATLAETENYAAATAEVKVRVGGSSSGGGLGSDRTPGGSSSTVTDKNPDGTLTTTVTDKETGTVTATTKKSDGTVEVVETKTDGTVTSTLTSPDGTEVKTVAEPEKEITAQITLPEDVSQATVRIPLELGAGTVAKNLETGELIILSVPTEDGMLVKVDGNVKIALVDNSKEFEDMQGHWAEEAVDFASARNIFNGTSETSFSPIMLMDRAMMITILARLDGEDTSGGSTWYEKGVDWASRNEISDGSNLERQISREELVTMIYRYAKSKGAVAVSGKDGELQSFADVENVSAWAVEAMEWAVENGIIKGTPGNTLMPKDVASRAEVSTVIYRLSLVLVK